ncbi:MAG: T9SS type A sorting domain-containing protein [Sphingobacteriales bacterium]|nr:MAG: T9SS type A sorting domain-containing protein [Sphingobacteriales bacterium]
MIRTYLFSLLFFSTLLVNAQHNIQLVKALKLPVNEFITTGVDFNGKYIFSTTKSLWVSDGTDGGTVMLNQDFQALQFYKSSGLVFMIVQHKQDGRTLWVTDGTQAGTKQVNGKTNWVWSNSTSGCAGIRKNELYFFANDGQHGWEIWKSDGTDAGTVMIKDINPAGDCFTTSSDASLLVVGSTVYFSANDNLHGPELWTTNGTEAGTKMVTDLLPGQEGVNPYSFLRFDNKLVFSTAPPYPSEFYKLCMSDGTESGTYVVADFYDASGEYLELNSKLYLLGYGDTTTVMYTTNGQPGNLIKLGKAELSATIFRRNFFTALNNKIYFTHFKRETGSEIWETDGTSGGTRMTKDVYPYAINNLAYSSQPGYLTSFGNRLFFRALDSTGISYIWSSDGTEAGTKVVPYQPAETLPPNLMRTFAHRNYMHVVGDELYFGAAWEKHGDTIQTTALYKMNLFPTSVRNVKHTATLALYPNPTKDLISFNCTDAVAVFVCNMAGNVVLQDKLSGAENHRINVSNLPAGLYTITVNKTDNSSSSAVFIKE